MACQRLAKGTLRGDHCCQGDHCEHHYEHHVDVDRVDVDHVDVDHVECLAEYHGAHRASHSHCCRQGMNPFERVLRGARQTHRHQWAP